MANIVIKTQVRDKDTGGLMYSVGGKWKTSCSYTAMDDDDAKRQAGEEIERMRIHRNSRTEMRLIIRFGN